MHIITTIDILIIGGIYILLLFVVFSLFGLMINKKICRLFTSLVHEIHTSVVPHHLTISTDAKNMVPIAISAWKLGKRACKLAESLDDTNKESLESAINKLLADLEKVDVTVTDMEGERYNEGMNLEILHIEKDINLKESVIKETVEPTVFLKGQMVNKGKIILLSNE